MDSVIFVCDRLLSVEDVANFVEICGGTWHSGIPPKGVLEQGCDVLYFYPPIPPATEYSPDEIKNISKSRSTPLSILPIDIGRTAASKKLAKKICFELVEKFGGWIDED